LLVLALVAPGLEAQTPRQQVDNLRAFAKAYGYVKYFHPSDEAAQVDWNRFAAHGAMRVKGARNEQELRETLTSLFAPLAPSARFHGKAEPANLPQLTFSHDAVVAWQHRGVTLDSGGQENIYQSQRLNRVVTTGGNGAGILNHSLPVGTMAGKRVRLSGQVRAEVAGQEGSARLWLRVDLPERKVGFFDNMEARPVTTSQWQRYEIVGDIPANATALSLGTMLVGKGKAAFDEVVLEVEVEGTWTPVPLPDPGYEQTRVGASPAGWGTFGPGYQMTVEASGAAAGKQCLVIQTGSSLARPIFAAVPKAGETVTKAIAPGLMLSFPLALPVEGMPTAKDFAVLKQTLATMPKLSTEEEGVRLGNLVSAWNVFQHFYPYFDVVKADWEAALTEALEQGLKDRTPGEHRVTLQKLVARLRDGHGAVFYKDAGEGDLPARFDWIEDRLVVTAVTEGSPFKRGDIVVSVDGVTGRGLLDEAESRVSGSDALRRHRALNIVGYGKLDAVAKVVVRRGGKDQTLDIPRVKPFGSLFFKSLNEFGHEAFKDLGNGCYYINESGLEKSRFKELLPVLAKAKGLILDQRPMRRVAEPLDLLDLVPHLAKEPTTSAQWHTPQIIRPDREDMAFLQSRWPLTPPAQPHISARVLVINVPSVVSYGESIMGIYEHYKLAEFVGEPTAGCNGNANIHVLPGEMRVMWTGMKVLKHDGSQHHLVGIRPTHPVTRTIKAVAEGRDEYLEKAIDLLKAQ